MRILLLEDDYGIGDALQSSLGELGFNVDWLADGALGETAPDVAPYDAIILDLGLPHVDGLALLRAWRQYGVATPVLILTARDALPDRVSGLNAGADDYLGKPFAIEEVVARLHALIRRYRGQQENTCQFGALSFNQHTHTVTLNGEEIPLNKRELMLLDLLLSEPKRKFSRADIEEKLYSWEQEVASNAVEAHISNLRKKMGKNIVKTHRGIGYQLGEKP